MEIEIKILEINKKEMINKLIQLGAKKIIDDNVLAYYFDKDNNFSKKGIILRLRKIGNKNYLTFKEKISDKEVSLREEYETEINDFDNMKLILLNLGYQIIATIEKHRTSFKINETLFEIDEHLNENSFIPCLMEIESTNKENINKYIKLLNIKKNQLSKLGFFGLRKKYLGK